MSEVIPAALPQSAPVSTRTPASGLQNPDAEGPGKDSFAAAFESAQRPVTSPPAAEAPAAEEKSADLEATTDPSAANPAAAALVLAALPVTPPSSATPDFSSDSASLAKPGPTPAVALTLVDITQRAAAAAGQQATEQGAQPAPAFRLPYAGGEVAPASEGETAALQPVATPPANAVSQPSDARAAGAGTQFPALLAALGLKPAADAVQSDAAPPAQVAAGSVEELTPTLASAAVAAAAEADVPALQLPDVPALVVEQAQGTDGDSASSSAATSLAVGASQTPPATARTHAGVLHLDTQLPVHSPRFSEGFTQQVVVLAQNGIQQAQMSLSPPDLGPIDVRITLQQDAATVQIAAASAVAREAIQDALPRLRDMLDQSGVRLNDAGVFAQLPQREQSAGSQQQRADWRMASGLGNGASTEQPSTLTPVLRRVGLLDAYA